MDPEVARIVVPPEARPVATPVLLIVATAELLEDQVTLVVMFRLVPSE